MSEHIHNMDIEDNETLFHHSYPYAYYVQSPSTISHAHSADIKTNIFESTFHSPTRSDTNVLTKNPEVSRFTLSRYSSSRGSNNSFLNEKKVSGDESGVNRLVIVDSHGFGDGGYLEEEDEEDEYYEGRRNGWWWRYCSFRRSNSAIWISFQICWRLFVSLGVALLVFYVVTKPPPPKISLKMAGIREFGLGEGIDGSGVTTKILNCNCSVNLLIENRSRLFGLHIHSPFLQLSFGHLPFAMSRGSKLYAESRTSTTFRLSVGTRNKPMYGAGRNMQDMLESGNGLPITVQVSFSSYYRVVWDIIKPKFHQNARCLLLLDSKYDKKHRTQAFKSTCMIS